MAVFNMKNMEVGYIDECVHVILALVNKASTHVSLFVFMQLENIEKEIETAIANDEIYAATVPVPHSAATLLEFREYEVCTFVDFF